MMENGSSERKRARTYRKNSGQYDRFAGCVPHAGQGRRAAVCRQGQEFEKPRFQLFRENC